jgi:16S rRNA (guanine527-N7)-methyltransferase
VQRAGLPAAARRVTSGSVSEFVTERDSRFVDELAAAFGRSLEPETREQLCAYAALVASWNRKLNLTGAGSPRALSEVLMADAFVLEGRELVPEGAHAIDVGSGAGAPIIPLLLLRPDLRALAVEPRAKRATFLRTASARLGLLQRLRVLEARVEPERPETVGTGFDVACSRATFEPERWLALGLQLAPRVLVMLASAAPPAAPATARLAITRDYQLPFAGSRRGLALYLRE